MTQIYSFPCSLNWISIIYISLNNSDKYIQKFTCYNPIIYFSYCSLRLNQRKLIKSVLTGNQSLRPSLLRSQSHNLYAPSICLVIYLTLLHSEKHQHIWQKSSMYVYLILCWLYSLRNFFVFLFLFFFFLPWNMLIVISMSYLHFVDNTMSGCAYFCLENLEASCCL